MISGTRIAILDLRFTIWPSNGKNKAGLVLSLPAKSFENRPIWSLFIALAKIVNRESQIVNIQLHLQPLKPDEFQTLKEEKW